MKVLVPVHSPLGGGEVPVSDTQVWVQNQALALFGKGGSGCVWDVLWTGWSRAQ